jgi:hypothetical protein
MHLPPHIAKYERKNIMTYSNDNKPGCVRDRIVRDDAEGLRTGDGVDCAVEAIRLVSERGKVHEMKWKWKWK